MLKRILLVLILNFHIITSAFAADKISSDVWNSDEGLKKLERSNFKKDFYQLVNFYQPQENPAFCSIAVTTMIRNALEYGKIPSQKTGELQTPNKKTIEYHLYSQNDFFNDKSEKIKKRSVIEYREISAKSNDYDAGLSMDDLAKILQEVHGLNVYITHINKNDENSISEFRDKLKNILNDNNHFIVANFDGKIIDKKTRGHFSPLVVYDEESDSVMVMDVALHKNQWYWVKLEKLLAAMNSKDQESYRGYLIIGKK